MPYFFITQFIKIFSIFIINISPISFIAKMSMKIKVVKMKKIFLRIAHRYLVVNLEILHGKF